MAMKKIVRKYDNITEFIVGDHFVNIKRMHPKATSEDAGAATLVGDRYIVTAGTLITKSETVEEVEVVTPIGFAYRDIDVTDGDAMIPITVHAVVRESALPAEVSAEDKAALNGIVFV